MTDAIKQNAINSLGSLSLAISSAADAKAYALTCFHQPSEYWAEHVLKLIADTREHLDRAEAMLTAKEPANV